MGIVGGAVAAHLLKTISPLGQSSWMVEGVPPAYRQRSKLEVLFGPGIWNQIRDKFVVDFGCGEGHEVVELAGRGARRVVGIDNYPPWFASATERVRNHGLSETCSIVETWSGRPAAADLVICLDSFEHFERPKDILELMATMLKPSGSVLVAFGPTWYHPYGGHLFSVFPYAHLLFSERALVKWRGTLPGKEPKQSFLDAGLNKMTVKRFERLVRESPFRFASFEAVPIRSLRRFANRVSREFTTSVVRCRLEPRR